MASQFAVQQPRAAVRARILQAITAQGGTLTAQSDDMITAGFVQKASCLITFILMWFAILPGVLYWFWGKKTQNLLVQMSGDDSSTWVSVTSSGKAAAVAEQAIRAAFGETAGQKVAGAVASSTASAAKAVGSAAASAGRTVADRVRNVGSQADSAPVEQEELSAAGDPKE